MARFSLVDVADHVRDAQRAQPREHRLGRLAGRAAALMVVPDDPRDLCDEAVVADRDLRLDADDDDPRIVLAQHPVWSSHSGSSTRRAV